ncbi:response regulator [Caulobacter sp. FWC2]|uniref:response regulator n=1 Tax=Caulobacter sp. FWC2 TaxID=69664 RepID=UPI000C151D1C|nr:response regulator [Caulobacter sp. FWC2]PIB93264.1 response regulator [Caulobacter sp. FWC2]
MSSEIGEAAEGAVTAAPVVLVVEDEVLVRMLACDILRDAGYDALEAVDAQEALVLLDARPDVALLFTDVDMPGEINGLGLARLVSLRWPNLPIIATSGAATVDPVDLPPNGRFLQKPYRPSTLIECVEAAAVIKP